MSITVITEPTGTTIDLGPTVEIHLDGDTNGHGIYLGPGGTRRRRPAESREKLLRGRLGRPVLRALGVPLPAMHGRADGTNFSGVDHYAHFWSETVHVSTAVIAGIRAARAMAAVLPPGRWEDEACAVMLAAVLAFEAIGGVAPDTSENTFGDQRAVLRRIPGGWETVSGGYPPSAVVTRRLAA